LRDGFADCLMGLSIREEVEDLPAEAPGKTDTSFLEDAPAPSDTGERDLSRAATRHFKSAEAMIARANGDAQRAATEPEAPPRSALWDAPSYELAARKTVRGRHNWRRLYDDLLQLIGDAATADELQKLLRDNEHAINQLGVSVPRGREVLDQAFASRTKAIRGE
jgi:hypothetical protein